MNDFLAGTTNGLFMIKNDEVYRIFDKDTYFGISWDIKTLYLANREKRAIISINEKLSRITAKWGFSGLHDIFYFDNKLYIVETQRNAISIYNFINKTLEKYHHLGYGYDRNHINNLFVYDNKLYVVEHNRTRNTGNKSRVAVYDFEKMKIIDYIDDVGIESHNVYIEDDKMYVCSSMEEGVCIIDLNTNEREFINVGQYIYGLTRGLSATNKYFYIGVSEYKERKRRHAGGTCHVLQFDRDWNLIDQIKIVQSSQLNEIRIMDEIDLCHNGIPFPREMDSRLLEIENI